MRSPARAQLKAKKQVFVQDEILASAAGLFAASGFRGVTIDDIASSLGYSKSVIYYYFKNKNEVLWNIFQKIHDVYIDDIKRTLAEELTPQQALAQIIRSHALNVMQKRDLTTIYFRDESELNDQQRRQISKRKREYTSLVEGLYARGVAEGVFRPLDAHIAVSGILGTCNWLSHWYKPEGKRSAEEIADQFVRLLADGYAPALGDRPALAAEVARSQAAE